MERGCDLADLRITDVADLLPLKAGEITPIKSRLGLKLANAQLPALTDGSDERSVWLHAQKLLQLGYEGKHSAYIPARKVSYKLKRRTTRARHTATALGKAPNKAQVKVPNLS